jgi:hypothetical protein
MVAGCALAIAHPASARGRKQLFFRVELSTGKVEAVSQGPPAPVERWPSPVTESRRSITSDERTILVYDEATRVPIDRTPIAQLVVPGSGAGWIPWRVLQGNTVVYAWREEVPDHRSEYRDLARAIDLSSRKVLWERVLTADMPPGAAGVGADHLVVDQPGEVLVLVTRTGQVVRRMAKTEPSFAVTRPRPGRVWVEAGGVVECLDEATMRTVWRLPKQGGLLWLLPIPGGDDWLLKTNGHDTRVRAADGHVAWSTASASVSRPLVHGDRIYEGTLGADRGRRHAQMVLIERDLRTGKAVREHPLGAYDTFYDQSSLTAVEVRDGWIDVAADFIILD